MHSPKKTPSQLGFYAKNEQVNTVMNGLDGDDYIVDIIKGVKTWIPYDIQSNDEEIIEYVESQLDDKLPKKKAHATARIIKKVPHEPQSINLKKPTIYNIKIGEFIKEIGITYPDLEKGQRMKKAQEMYREWKSKLDV
jgi:hypothetical protein